MDITFVSAVTPNGTRSSAETLDFATPQELIVPQRYGSYFHDDIIKWKHFPRYWPFFAGNSPAPVNSPHKGQWRGSLIFSLIYAWINDWINNREAGDLRRHRGHYDVIVMYMCNFAPHFHYWYIGYFQWNYFRWKPQNFTGDKSTLVQVIFWCRPHWQGTMTPKSVTKPQSILA